MKGRPPARGCQLHRHHHEIPFADVLERMRSERAGPQRLGGRARTFPGVEEHLALGAVAHDVAPGLHDLHAGPGAGVERGALARRNARLDHTHPVGFEQQPVVLGRRGERAELGSPGGGGPRTRSRDAGQTSPHAGAPGGGVAGGMHAELYGSPRSRVNRSRRGLAMPPIHHGIAKHRAAQHRVHGWHSRVFRQRQRSRRMVGSSAQSMRGTADDSAHWRYDDGILPTPRHVHVPQSAPLAGFGGGGRACLKRTQSTP